MTKHCLVGRASRGAASVLASIPRLFHCKGNGRISTAASSAPAARPPRIASTMSRASRVSRKTRPTEDSLILSAAIFRMVA